VTTIPQRPEAGHDELEPAALPARQVPRSPASPLRDLRPSRTPAAMIVALLLLAAGALAVTEIGLARTGRPSLLTPRERVAAAVTAARWDDPVVLGIAGLAAAVGVLLLGLALVPGRPRALVLACDSPGVVLTIGRRSVRRLLGRDATRVEGVKRARVSLRRRRVIVRVTGRSRVHPEARAQVERAVSERIEQLAPVRPAGLRVRVRWKEARR
jgi:uncharacterized protein DUF6286